MPYTNFNLFYLKHQSASSYGDKPLKTLQGASKLCPEHHPSLIFKVNKKMMEAKMMQPHTLDECLHMY
jgi:hypothetical protein